MPDHDSLEEILGKTIKGVVVKHNVNNTSPAVSLFLVFSDDTSYEIYSMFSMNFCSGVYARDMEGVRRYLSGPGEPMVNVLDLSLDEE